MKISHGKIHTKQTIFLFMTFWLRERIGWTSDYKCYFSAVAKYCVKIYDKSKVLYVAIEDNKGALKHPKSLRIIPTIFDMKTLANCHKQI